MAEPRRRLRHYRALQFIEISAAGSRKKEWATMLTRPCVCVAASRWSNGRQVGLARVWLQLQSFASVASTRKPIHTSEGPTTKNSSLLGKRHEACRCLRTWYLLARRRRRTHRTNRAGHMHRPLSGRRPGLVVLSGDVALRDGEGCLVSSRRAPSIYLYPGQSKMSSVQGGLNWRREASKPAETRSIPSPLDGASSIAPWSDHKTSCNCL